MQIQSGEVDGGCWDENVGPKSQGGEIIVPISQAKDIQVDDGHTASEN